MNAPQPIYSADQCAVAWQLNWAVSLFANAALPDIHPAVETVRPLLEDDGVRILEYRTPSSKVVEFLLSTKPPVAPARLLQVLKGRLQHAVRAVAPKVFRRNYRLESVGSAQARIVESYVSKQVERHPSADTQAVERLRAFQICPPDVDRSRIRYTAHGEFLYNLHVVLEHAGDWHNTREGFLRRTERTILGVCDKHLLLLSRAGIVSNHLHLALGCNIGQSPTEVALCFLNNLAYAHGQVAIYKFGFYVGTYGNFDLGALRKARGTDAAEQPVRARGSP